MIYTSDYDSPLGKILIAADKFGLTGLWFYGQKNFAATLTGKCIKKSVKTIDYVKTWLDKYFAGEKPNYLPPLHIICSPFQYKVWDYIMNNTTYGKLITYKTIAAKLNTSPRAVGRALAQNHILIVIPCHRVIGTNNNLTGYIAGVERKKKLLAIEEQII